jgi:hypothetical protein
MSRGRDIPRKQTAEILEYQMSMRTELEVSYDSSLKGEKLTRR